MAADFNDDGRTDLAVADSGLNEVSIFLGNGNGTFDALPPIMVPGGPYALVAGDFTGNGRIDLAVADQSSSTVTILLGNGDGTFNELAPIALANPSSIPDAIVAGYFSGSGHLDLAVADQSTDDVTVLLGNGDGTFQVQTPISLPFGLPSNLSLVAGDFLNNGRHGPRGRRHRLRFRRFHRCTPGQRRWDVPAPCADVARLWRVSRRDRRGRFHE